MSRDKGAKNYMKDHPGVTYVEALRIVRAERHAAWAAREESERSTTLGDEPQPTTDAVDQLPLFFDPLARGVRERQSDTTPPR